MRLGRAWRLVTAVVVPLLAAPLCVLTGRGRWAWTDATAAVWSCGATPANTVGSYIDAKSMVSIKKFPVERRESGT